MNVRALSTLGLVAAFTLGACGSSGGSSALSKADWATQANAICKDMHDRAAALTPKSEADYGPAITKLAVVSADDIAKLSALKPPAEIQSDVTAMVTAYQTVNKGLQDGAAKVASGDVQGGVHVVSTASEAGMAGDPIATRLGATECAKNN